MFPPVLPFQLLYWSASPKLKLDLALVAIFMQVVGPCV